MDFGVEIVPNGPPADINALTKINASKLQSWAKTLPMVFNQRRMLMKTLVILGSLAVLLGAGYASAQTMTSGRPSAVLNKQQCKSVWKTAVPTGRFLYRADAAPFIVNFAQADGPDQDGRISRREFKKACRKGLVKYRNW
jgi:hypothetical protein